MKLYIDADGCPVIDAAIKTAEKYGLRSVIVCDSAHIFNRTDAEIIVVGTGADSADFKLVNMIGKADIAVTQDYGLAAMCLAKSAFVLNQNGLVFTNDNIDGLLLSRHTAKKLRNSGKRLKGPSKRTPQQDKDFIAALEQIIINNM